MMVKLRSNPGVKTISTNLFSWPGLSQFVPLSLLGLLTVIFFWKILLTNLILIGVDVFLYFYPYKAYATRSLLAGHFPLWNPHIFMGVPFLANSQAGLLYPLNWLFLWAEPPKQVAYSIGLHIWIAGVGAYLFARQRFNLTLKASLAGGMIFAFSGFLGAQVEHLNQLQVSAWTPWIFLIFDRIAAQQLPSHTAIIWRGPDEWANGRLGQLWQARRNIAFLSFIISLMLLAGHTQSVYISLFGLGFYGLFRRGIPWGGIKNIIRVLTLSILDMAPLIPALLLAILISSAQLLPTYELTQQSIRSDGLTYRETVAFSLNPLKSWLTILPPYGIDLEATLGPAFSEFVAYIGLLPLLLALAGSWRLWRIKAPKEIGLGITGAMGLFLAFGVFTGPIYLALYLVIPGFNFFRVPARWLLLYTFAMAMLAAIGFERLKKARWQWLLLSLIPLELFLAAQSLRYNKPTAPEAYSSLRPAIVQLKAAQAPTDRFLSLSGIEYDPGDLAEINHIFADQLPERAIYDYVIAAKEKEVLFFNLPMVYGLNAVDGYDGGLLPLKRFVEWQRLFLPEEDISPDGRLREKLNQVPPGRLLSMFGVRHIITDKVHDVWLNNIFYDLQFPARLNAIKPEIWTTDIPPLPASAIGVIFHTPEIKGRVAQLVVRYHSGVEERFDLQAGVGLPWENGAGIDYNIVFDLRTQASNDEIAETTEIIEPIEAIGLIAETEVSVRGISLIQRANTTSRSLILSTEGDYRPIHGGDVKIYENLAALPPAFIVHQADIVPDIEAAIARLQEPDFDPAIAMVRLAPEDNNNNEEEGQRVILGQSETANALTKDSATVTRYSPEQIELSATLGSPGWLVLMDTFYPGWQAWANGEMVEILEVNIMFRAIQLPAGNHKVVFSYRPQSFYFGVGMSLLGLILLGVFLIQKAHQAKS